VTPPPNIIWHNVSSTSIKSTWKPIPPHLHNGIVIGYDMSFWKQSDPQNVTNVTVSEEVKMFEDLEKWTIYCGQVSAFTRIGEGPRSQVECIRTSEDGNYYYLVKPRENWVTFLRKQFEKCRCFYAFHTFLSVFMSSISSLIFFCTSLSISSTVSPVLCFPLSRSPAPYYL
jgi:hypothetical protein